MTHDWIEGLPAAVTVTDAAGTIIALNKRACETFAAEGGAKLIGSNVFDCHPEPSRTMTIELYRTQQPNHYTIHKNGVIKMIHQVPWFDEAGAFAGFVEFSIPLPARAGELPHHDRG